MLAESILCHAGAERIGGQSQVSHGADAIKFVATGGVLSDIKAGLDQQLTTKSARSSKRPIAWVGASLHKSQRGCCGATSPLKGC